MKKNIFTLIFFIAFLNITAQEQIEKIWEITLHMNTGYSFTTSDWEYTHPYHLGNGGLFTGSISGTYEESYGFAGGFELSKGYFGYGANIGMFPAKFLINKQVDPGVTQMRSDVYSYNSIYLEAEGVFFPLGNPSDNITPFVKIGLGVMRTTGDIKNNLLSFSGSTGAKIFITANLGVDLSLKYRYMLLYDVKLAEQISAAYGVSLSALSANVGLLYRL